MFELTFIEKNTVHMKKKKLFDKFDDKILEIEDEFEKVLDSFESESILKRHFREKLTRKDKWSLFILLFWLIWMSSDLFLEEYDRYQIRKDFDKEIENVLEWRNIKGTYDPKKDTYELNDLEDQ